MYCLRRQYVEQEAALSFKHTDANIDTIMPANNGVDGVFVDYLARTVEAATASYHPLHNRIDRNSSNNNDNHVHQDDNGREKAPSPELSRKV